MPTNPATVPRPPAAGGTRDQHHRRPAVGSLPSPSRDAAAGNHGRLEFGSRKIDRLYRFAVGLPARCSAHATPTPRRGSSAARAPQDGPGTPSPASSARAPIPRRHPARAARPTTTPAVVTTPNVPTSIRPRGGQHRTVQISSGSRSQSSSLHGGAEPHIDHADQQHVQCPLEQWRRNRTGQHRCQLGRKTPLHVRLDRLKPPGLLPVDPPRSAAQGRSGESPGPDRHPPIDQPTADRNGPRR
ncbi:MAG: hypothetical protein CM1200mP2_56360 [Planctomycetaceae bacterium]|nr:MAG: hypothetical protein CM1200mP2_56360 [Planctomycetaceae bacterium]